MMDFFGTKAPSIPANGIDGTRSNMQTTNGIPCVINQDCEVNPYQCFITTIIRLKEEPYEAEVNAMLYMYVLNTLT